jgi:hypothetical protein
MTIQELKKELMITQIVKKNAINNQDYEKVLLTKNS